MSSTENLLQATVNRLVARFSQKIIDTAATFSVLTKDGPEKLRKELEIFQKEVKKEAERLDQEKKQSETTADFSTQSFKELDAQGKVDQLRAKIADLSRKIEKIS